MNETTIEEVRRQLSVLHGVPVPPPYDPRASMMANWGADPFGGAYHTWNVGARSWEVMPRIRKPLPQPLFVCGEAWSNDQGWINGALQTTERMLADHFSLDRPDWLPASAPLGV
jgi:monoamine oxidase